MLLVRAAHALGQFVWRPAGHQHEAVAPNGAVRPKSNWFAYGQEFFTEEQTN